MKKGLFYTLLTLLGVAVVAAVLVLSAPASKKIAPAAKNNPGDPQKGAAPSVEANKVAEKTESTTADAEEKKAAQIIENLGEDQQKPGAKIDQNKPEHQATSTSGQEKQQQQGKVNIYLVSL